MSRSLLILTSILAAALVAGCLSVPSDDEPEAAVVAQPEEAAAAPAQPAAQPAAPAVRTQPFRPPPPKMIPDTGDNFVGNRAPSVEIGQLDGGTFSVEALRGKPVILSFWASWCGPCRREMPELETLYQEYKSTGLVVVGVNVDREIDPVRKFLSTTPVNFPIALDSDSELLGLYQVASMPTSFMIDKRGVVVHKKVGFRDEDIAEYKQMIDAM